MNDGLLDIILGRSELSTFDQLVRDWRSQGGDQIRSEFEQGLQAAEGTSMLTREENEPLCRVGAGRRWAS